MPVTFIGLWISAMTPVFLSCVGDKRIIHLICLVIFFVNLSRQRLNFYGFVLVVKISLTLSVPYIFIYKDMNIFISALSGRSVGSIGNEFSFVFFLALRSIAGWYIFSFFTVWFLNQYHSFVFFNHNYSDTWLSFQINIACFYHLRVFCHDSKNLEISLWVSLY